MAIQMRRGQYGNFDPSRMVAGEYAVVLSGDPDGTYGRGVYMAFAPGTVERVITESDMSVYAADLVDQTAAAEAAATAANAAAAVAGPAATAANTAATSANSAATSANSAARSANTAATAANNAAASAIAASGNRLTATLSGTGTPDTASDAWTGPLIGATVDGLSVQDGTPTPSAPVAIKSVEGAAAVVAGRNLAIIEQGGMINDGLNGPQTDLKRVRSKNYIRVVPGETVRFSATSTAGYTLQVGISYYMVADYTTARFSSTGWLAASASSHTVPAGALYARILVKSSAEDNISPSTVQIMFERGATLHPYEPCELTSTPLLPSTAAPLRSLPDGTHDELSVGRDGTVSVIRRVGTVTYDGDETWSISGGNKRVYNNALRSLISKAATNSTVVQTVCTHFTPETATQTYGGTVGVSVDTSGDVGFANGETMSTAGWNTWLQSNPVTLYYPLATPTTETLPSVTMPTVPSRNLTAWTDATDADGAAIAAPWEMEYERDVTYVIEQLEQAIADI